MYTRSIIPSKTSSTSFHSSPEIHHQTTKIACLRFEEIRGDDIVGRDKPTIIVFFLLLSHKIKINVVECVGGDVEDVAIEKVLQNMSCELCE